MKGEGIVALYFHRDEDAIRETQIKYGDGQQLDPGFALEDVMEVLEAQVE